VDADEIWCWHKGSPLDLGTARHDKDLPAWQLLGPEIATGHAPQIVVPKDYWQSARATLGWALVTCVVAPGFEFAGFTLAPPNWTPAP